MAFEFDDVLEQIGSFGRYQKFAIFILLFPSGFFSAFMMNQLLFQVVVPDHWCHVPGRETTGMSTDEWRALTIPRSNSSGRYSSCLRYKVTWSGNASFSPSEGDSASFSPSEGDNASFSPSEGDNAGFSPSEEDSASFSPSEGRNASFFLSNKTEECRSGWEFDSSQFKATLATTNQWFCERESYSQHALALNMAGNAFGTLILPFIGDKYVGRRVILYVALAIHVVFTIPLVWISNVGFHLLFRFLAGLGYLSYSLVPYVIVVETVGSRRRALTTGLYYGTWTAGMCFTALVAFLVPHWQYLALISCVPPIIFLLFLRLVPESPRWLLSKGRVTECARILLQVAKTNGNQEVTKQDLKKKLCDIVDKQVEEVSIKNALRYPILRWRLVSLLTIAMCVYMSYGVILMGINVLPSNYFLSHFILSVSQLPATATSWVFMQYLGRRFSSMASALLFIVLCVVATFCTHDAWALVVVIGALRLCLAVQMQVMFVQVVELLPTPVRSSGLGLYTVFGLCAMTASPYILHSGQGSSFHYWVLVGLMLLSLILCIPLPETLGHALPQTFQEAEDLGFGRPMATWIHHWNLHKYPAASNAACSTCNSCNPDELEPLQDIENST
ncbi:solute carrier family 22 member 1 [Procambarus clarkii]|uniref:solute carrier family 22 member 1 n=1 Tax=Procambarus clarkii TaxID=6728 RepID=UPI001E6720C3|nr:solute carrier family 22 member 1-like isoform X1 [Procambarus clarkii]